MRRFRDFVLGVLVTSLVMGLAVPALAASYNKNMSVTYRDIKISVNGTYFTPKDANGRTVEPFIYEGTTYLPVRAVSEAVGYNVTWDNNTSTVYLTNGSGSGSGSGGTGGGSATAPAVNLIDTIAPYDYSGHGYDYGFYYYPSTGSGSITMGGTSYKNSMSMKAQQYNDCYGQFNLGGKYTLLSGVIGAVDGGSDYGDPSVVSIYGDGVLLKTIEVAEGSLPAAFSVNVTGVSQLKFIIPATWRGDTVGIAELLIQ